MTTPPPPVPPESMPPSGGASNNDDKSMALVAHFGLIIGVLPALIIYLIKGDIPWVKNEAAKAFNFGLIPTAVWIVLTMFNLFAGYGLASIGIGCITCLLILSAWGVLAVFGVMNGIKVNDGGESKYPFEIPILK